MKESTFVENLSITCFGAGLSDIDSDESSNDGEHGLKCSNLWNIFPSAPESNDDGQQNILHEPKETDPSTYGGNYYQQCNGLRWNGLNPVKSFIGQTPFSEGYNENLEDFLGIYNDLAKSCDVAPRQTLTAISIALKGPARSYLAKYGITLYSYD